MDLIISGGEPRVQDLRLAAMLEFERPRNIRKLIERNKDELERYGEVCSTVEQTPEGGRPSREYWLNEGQALLICTKSDTPRAPDAREEIITGFQAYRHGKTVPARAATIEEIDKLFDTKLEPIRDHLVRHDGNIAYLMQMGGEHRDQLRALVPERQFSKEDKRRFALVVRQKYNSECPCCRDIRILDDSGEPIRGIAHCDHVRGHNLNGPHDGWYICAGCNQKLRDYEARAESMGAHREFIRLLKKIFAGHPAKSRKKIAASDQNSFVF